MSIDPAPGRGVLPLPTSALKAGFPVLGNPANARRAVTLTFEEFQYGWANGLDEQEARQLYDEFHVAASGVPIFQAAVANLNLFSETRVHFTAENRGPLLMVSGEKDHTVPHSIAHAAYKKHLKNAVGDGVRRDAGPRPFADDRPRLAGGRPDLPGLHPQVRPQRRLRPGPLEIEGTMT